MGPPTSVLFCLQAGKGELVNPVRATGRDLAFDFELQCVAGDPPRLLGRFAQGPPAARFVYVCSGTSAGDIASAWTRRAKIPLAGITNELIARARGARLEARISGTAKDGGPACATVPLLGGGWLVR